MGTLRQAFHDMGIPVGKYYSSEIKPYANKLANHHFPDTIQVGDINNWREWDIDWATIDFIGSGSPCQDLSIAGKRKGITGERSSLFFVFVEILNHIKKLNPNVLFLQENVGSASRKDVGIMSRALGVYPARINSKLLTAQLRDRYYWTNIKTKPFGMFGDIESDISQPKDLGIQFKDILTSGEPYNRKKNKHACLSTNSATSAKSQEALKHIHETTGMISLIEDKAHSLLQSDRKFMIKDPTAQDKYINSRSEKGKQLPNIITEQDNELRIKTNDKIGYKVITEEDCIDLSFPTSTTRRGRVTEGKSPCLLRQNNLYSYDGTYLRLVNKVEMCRLQGFEDSYTDTVSLTQAGSLLGDGWTLPVIIHILNHRTW